MATYPAYNAPGGSPTAWYDDLKAYIDESGAEPALPDTGWRAIGALYGEVAGSIKIRRVGPVVDIEINGEFTDPGGNVTGGLLPTGFSGMVSFPIFDTTTEEPSMFTVEENTLSFRKEGGTPAGGYSGAGTYTTSDPFPTVLPGAEVTPPGAVSLVTGDSLGLPDTGWRDLGPASADSGTGTASIETSFARRIGDTCFLQIGFFLNVNTGGFGDYLPNGFLFGGASSGVYSIAADGLGPGGSDGITRVTLSSGSRVDVVSNVEDGQEYLSITYPALASDPFPSLDSLPGTEVTPPSVVPLRPAPEDTGLREYVSAGIAGPNGQPPLLESDAGLNYIHIRRIGQIVYFSGDGGLSGLGAGEAGSAPAGTWPAGFRPITSVRMGINVGAGSRGYLQVSPDGSYNVQAGSDDLDDYTTDPASWVTNEVFPVNPGGNLIPPQ